MISVGQRTHLNFVENIASYLIIIFCGAIKFPIPAACIGFLLIIGRIVYTLGYVYKGP